jgi:hypothetical protein
MLTVQLLRVLHRQRESAEKPSGMKRPPSSASLNTLTSESLNSTVAWVREVEALRRALAAT